MTAILMSFSRNGKRSRKVFADGKRCISKAKKKYRVPDTAHDCPILRIGVMQEQSVLERENLWKWELFYFFHSLSLHHKTTVITI